MINGVLPVSLEKLLRLPIGLLFSLLLVFPVHSAKLYKWVDENGNIRYSDKLSSGQSKNRIQTMTSSGRVLSTKEKAKTPEEARAERKRNWILAEENRIKAETAAKKAAKQKHYDNVLLMTFTNENEIVEVQNERLAVIDSVITLLMRNVKTEQGKLALQENIAKERYLDKKLEVPGGLAQKIEYFTEKVLSKQQHLGLKLDERKKVKRQYVNDRIRYQELTQAKKIK